MSPEIGLPLGILYIAAVMEENSLPVSIIDGQLGTVYPQDDGYNIGIPWDELEQRIVEEQPRIVGISNPYSVQLGNALQLAKLVKRIDPTIMVIAGGPHATVQPESFLQEGSGVDIAVMGEGEHTMLELVRRLIGKNTIDDIPGVVTRSNRNRPNKAEHIQNLDELPFPAYHLIDLEEYFELAHQGLDGRPRFWYPGAERSLSMITSRGCPYNCTFCSIHLHMGRILRKHSSAYVLKHINHLVNTYKVKHLHLEDDNLMLDRSRFLEILSGIDAMSEKITWDTPNGVRAHNLDVETVRFSKKTGCNYLIVGVESGDQQVLDTIVNKKLKLEDVYKAAINCEKNGMDLEAFFVVGFPGETQENIHTTINYGLDLLKKHGVYPYFFVATPLVGTRLYRICLEKGYLVKPITADNLAVSTQGVGMIRTPEFEPDWLNALVSKTKSRVKLLLIKRFFKRLLMHPGALVPTLIYALRPPVGHKLRNLLRYPNKTAEYIKAD